MTAGAAGLPRVGDSALVAEIYDISHPVGLSYGEVEYYQTALLDVAAPVLEVACGTGRILVPLLESGLAMEGLDVSAPMLELCRANAVRRGFDAPLHQADMADFMLPRRYGAVIIVSGSTRELPGRAGLARALRCCRECLLPGGRLIVDIAPPRLGTPEGGLRYWSRGTTLWTRQTVHSAYDGVARQATQLLRYEKFDAGRLVATELHALRIQHLTPDEVRETIAEAGLRLVAECANYQVGRPLGPQDDDWTFHCGVDEDTAPPQAAW